MMDEKTFDAIVWTMVVLLLTSFLISQVNPGLFAFGYTNEISVKINEIANRKEVRTILNIGMFYAQGYIVCGATTRKRNLEAKTKRVLLVAGIGFSVANGVDKVWIDIGAMIFTAIVCIKNGAKIKDLMLYIVAVNVTQVITVYTHGANIQEVFGEQIFVLILGSQSFAWQILIWQSFLRRKDELKWDFRYRLQFTEKKLKSYKQRCKKWKEELRNAMKREWNFWNKCRKMMPKILRHYMKRNIKLQNWKIWKQNKAKNDFLVLAEMGEIERGIKGRMELGKSVVIIGFMLMSAGFIFGRGIEMMYFCVAHTKIRNSMPKQYHKDTTDGCIMVTCGVVFLGALTMLPIEISILSSVPIAHSSRGQGQRLPRKTT